MVEVRIPGSDRTSSRRKFDRGIEQVRTLLKEIEEFESDQTSVEISTRPRRVSPTEIEVVCVARLARELPDHWALLAGDAVQNLRASLEHMVFSSTGGLNSNSGFPICDTAAKFRGEAKRRLRDVPPEICQVIEDLQPFTDSASAVHSGDSRYLALLRDLSNEDKHRVLATVLFAVRHEWLGLPQHANAAWTKLGTREEIKRETMEISTFMITSTQPIAMEHVEPGFRFSVELERKNPQILIPIAHAVHRTLFECEHGEAFSPFGSYPI